MGTSSELERTTRNGSSQFDYGKIVNGLGWFSLGLGIAEIAAPGAIARLVGIRDEPSKRNLLRSPLYGLREVTAGIGILTQPRPANWFWGRVAGDLLDISSVAIALNSGKNDRARATAGLIGLVGVTALDYLCAQQLSQDARNGKPAKDQATGAMGSRSSRMTRSIWVNKSPEEAYNFWRNFENLPRFMRHLESVQSVGEGRSRWRATGVLGKTFEWEARTVQEQPKRLIAWTSVEGSQINNAGSVFFEPGPGGRGTIIRVDLTYDPPGGAVGTGLARLLGKDARQMVADDLRAFKQVIETGEVIQSDASIHPGMHPAQPPEQPRGTASGLQTAAHA